MRKLIYGLIFGSLFLFVVIYASGLYPYLRSIARPIRPSIHESRSDDIFIPQTRPNGTILLLHGMNFEASKMIPLGHEMRAAGFEVFIPRLVGHRGLRSETHEYTLDGWSEQMQDWNRRFKSRKVCAGFSLGGLLLVSQYLEGRIDCDGFILFAPALALRTPVALAELVEKVWPIKLSIPSGIPDDYKHFSTLGLGPAFSALHLVKRVQEYLRRRQGLHLPPALVFIDPKDEVVNADEVGRMVESIPGWHLQRVNVLNAQDSHAFHLIIDEPHLGAEQWSKVRSAIHHFLRSEAKGERRVLEARTE